MIGQTGFAASHESSLPAIEPSSEIVYSLPPFSLENNPVRRIEIDGFFTIGVKANGK